MWCASPGWKCLAAMALVALWPQPGTALEFDLELVRMRGRFVAPPEPVAAERVQLDDAITLPPAEHGGRRGRIPEDWSPVPRAQAVADEPTEFFEQRPLLKHWMASVARLLGF